MMKLKNFFSLFNYTLETKLPGSEVSNRIATNTEPEKSLSLFKYSPATKMYKGAISNNSFTIRKAVEDRRSFLPVINGRINSLSSGRTQIELKIKPIAPAFIFILLCLGVSALISLLTLYALFFGYSGKLTTATAPLVAPFGLLIVVLLIVRFDFGAQAKKAKNALAKLLDAEDVSDRGDMV